MSKNCSTRPQLYLTAESANSELSYQSFTLSNAVRIFFNGISFRFFLYYSPFLNMQIINIHANLHKFGNNLCKLASKYSKSSIWSKACRTYSNMCTQYIHMLYRFEIRINYANQVIIYANQGLIMRIDEICKLLCLKDLSCYIQSL